MKTATGSTGPPLGFGPALPDATLHTDCRQSPCFGSGARQAGWKLQHAGVGQSASGPSTGQIPSRKGWAGQPDWVQGASVAGCSLPGCCSRRVHGTDTGPTTEEVVPGRGGALRIRTIHREICLGVRSLPHTHGHCGTGTAEQRNLPVTRQCPFCWSPRTRLSLLETAEPAQDDASCGWMRDLSPAGTAKQDASGGGSFELTVPDTRLRAG